MKSGAWGLLEQKQGVEARARGEEEVGSDVPETFAAVNGKSGITRSARPSALIPFSH